MKFTKMHGCGNDYVYVNCLEEKINNPNKVAKFISDRHFGIGSDGMICICPSDKLILEWPCITLMVQKEPCAEMVSAVLQNMSMIMD